MNKEKHKLQDRYNSLSLVERNAYEQIVERHTSKGSWLEFPLVFVKLITLAGIFFIVTALLFGVQISIFTEAYMQLAFIIIIITPIAMIIRIIFSIRERCKLNKLKRKLLNR